MKTWEEMSHKERAEKTVNDLMERKKIKEEKENEKLLKMQLKAEREAKSFTIERAYETNKRKRNAKGRGSRSL